jgi:hypothetical protein
MDTIELWARNGAAVREAMELGDLPMHGQDQPDLVFSPVTSSSGDQSELRFYLCAPQG